MNRNVTRFLIFIGVLGVLNVLSYTMHWGLWFY